MNKILNEKNLKAVIAELNEEIGFDPALEIGDVNVMADLSLLINSPLFNSKKRTKGELILSSRRLMKNKSCAYCGKITTKTDKEHVFPKCLYPKRKSKVQRLTIPSCRDCNSNWSEDEAHFRNVLVLAGEQ